MRTFTGVFGVRELAMKLIVAALAVFCISCAGSLARTDNPTANQGWDQACAALGLQGRWSRASPPSNSTYLGRVLHQESPGSEVVSFHSPNVGSVGNLSLVYTDAQEAALELSGLFSVSSDLAGAELGAESRLIIELTDAVIEELPSSMRVLLKSGEFPPGLVEGASTQVRVIRKQLRIGGASIKIEGKSRSKVFIDPAWHAVEVKASSNGQSARYLTLSGNGLVVAYTSDLLTVTVESVQERVRAIGEAAEFDNMIVLLKDDAGEAGKGISARISTLGVNGVLDVANISEGLYTTIDLAPDSFVAMQVFRLDTHAYRIVTTRLRCSWSAAHITSAGQTIRVNAAIANARRVADSPRIQLRSVSLVGASRELQWTSTTPANAELSGAEIELGYIRVIDEIALDDISGVLKLDGRLVVDGGDHGVSLVSADVGIRPLCADRGSALSAFKSPILGTAHLLKINSRWTARSGDSVASKLNADPPRGERESIAFEVDTSNLNNGVGYTKLNKWVLRGRVLGRIETDKIVRVDVGSLHGECLINSDGTFEYVVPLSFNTSSDVTLNVRGVSRTLTFVHDSADPEIRVVKPVHSPYMTRANQERVDLAIDDRCVESVTVAGQKASRGFAEGQWSADVPISNEGVNVVHIVVVDCAGNVANANVQFVRDTAPPKLLATIPESNSDVVTEEPVDITWIFDEDVAAAVCAGSKVEITGNRVRTRIVSPSERGEWRVVAEVRDASDNSVGVASVLSVVSPVVPRNKKELQEYLLGKWQFNQADYGEYLATGVFKKGWPDDEYVVTDATHLTHTSIVGISMEVSVRVVDRDTCFFKWRAIEMGPLTRKKTQ